MSIYNFTIRDGCAFMNFVSSSKYPVDLVESSFAREKKYILKLQKYNWAPEVTEINPATKTIAFKWYENPFPSNWKLQLEKIVSDLHYENIFKPSFYKKYFYVDDNNILHAFNFYTAFDYDENPVAVDFYRPILNQDREELINKLAPSGSLDLKKLMYYAFNDYIKWPDDALTEIYKKIYGL